MEKKGITGEVSSLNSFIGATANDRIGRGYIVPLSNGNFMIHSYNVDNGSLVDAGAVTFADGKYGITGVIDSSNSILGDVANARLGSGNIDSREISNGVLVIDDSSSAGGTIYQLSKENKFTNPLYANFSNSKEGDSTIRVADILRLLNAGVDVKLQANNDIILKDDLLVNNPLGDGGNLTLEAGRYIKLLADIYTDNGDLTALTGLASLNLNYKDRGLPNILRKLGRNIDVGSGKLRLGY